MKHKLFVLSTLIITILYFLINCAKEENKETELKTNDTLTVTYIGGAGSLFESQSRKVMLDAVFTATGVSGFVTPSSTVLNQVANSITPFNNIDLYLVTHGHADHIDPTTMDKCMKDNLNARLVCQQDIVDAIKAIGTNSYSSYKDRVIIPVLGDFLSLDTVLNNIEIKVTKLPAYDYHPHGILIFNIKLGNISLLDLLGPVYTTVTYNSNEFNNPDNDILFVGNDYLDLPYIFENVLHYKVAYIDHIYDFTNQFSQYFQISKEMTEKGHKTYVFSNPMQRITFAKVNGDIIIK